MEEEVPQAAPAASVAKWSGFYASGFAPWDAHRPASQLVAFLHDHPEGQRLLPPERSSTSAEVLEIGCGSGASCVWMAQQGMAVVGVDLVPLPLRAASAAATAVRAPAPQIKRRGACWPRSNSCAGWGGGPVQVRGFRLHGPAQLLLLRRGQADEPRAAGTSFPLCRRKKHNMTDTANFTFSTTSSACA